MRNDHAYVLLARELERWRLLAPDELRARIGQAPEPRVHHIEGMPLTIEIAVRWSDAQEKAVRVSAVAYGTSHWRVEKLEESVTIPLAGRALAAGPAGTD
jgi:hypothetical protein